MQPRIQPISDEELTDEIAEILPQIVVAGTRTAGRSNIFKTLVRHPALFQRWTPLLDGLLNGRLAPRDRELLILRTAWNCQSEYEWGQHVSLGRRIGLSDDEIRDVMEGPDAQAWPGDDRFLLLAADELHHDSEVGPGTWSRLAERYDEQEMIEILVVVGFYQLVAMVLKSIGVPADDGLPTFDDVRQL